MTYSIIGILASIILLIINRDVIWGTGSKELTKTEKNYRFFLFGVLAYLVTDMVWGILDSYHLVTILFLDTSVHFIAMAAAVMLWTRYAVSYLEKRNAFGSFLYYAGSIFLAFETLMVAVNIFAPVLFWFDDNGGYQAGIARYVTLAIQILLFALTSVYTLSMTARTEGVQRRRHLTIGLFGIAMVFFIAVQVFYPLLPFYAMGYMMGTCVLHTFVVEDERNEYMRELSESREALKDALSEAEHANRAKTAFLSNMSHEIRTPMNAIIGLNTIAMDDPTASDGIKEYLRKINDSAQHLLSVINDILDMSRIESGRMTVNNEEFAFMKGLSQINSMISGQCRDKGLDYECQVIGKIDDYYIGDGMKLKQVVINLLGNAVKFTPKGGAVRLIVEEGPRFDRKATLKIKVSDTGIGISEDYMPYLFDPFSQEDSSLTNKYGSTGLGMPITKSLVELMNGSIEVESKKGEGTTFTVVITLGEFDRKDGPQGQTGAEQAGEKQTRDGHAGAVRTGEDPANEETADSAVDGSEVDLRGRRVLLAEDVAVNAEIIKMVLAMKEIEVDHAENGKTATEMFGSHEEWYYDAVLMDMRMPEMDGLEATKVIRSMDRDDAKMIPVIALTANAFDDDVKRSMQAGLDAHLSKPVEPDVLFGTLERLIGQRRRPEAAAHE